MHKMRTIAIDDPGVCQYVNLSVCHTGGLCKTAKRIDVLFGMEAPEH